MIVPSFVHSGNNSEVRDMADTDANRVRRGIQALDKVFPKGWVHFN